MASVLEVKEIGLAIGTSGTHENTFYDETTKSIKLVKTVESDGDGKPLYEEFGQWTSDVVNLEDNFNDFQKVFAKNTDEGTSHIVIQTRVSDDGIQFDEWIPLAEDGTIQSETKQYVQVRIQFYAGLVPKEQIVSDFNKTANASLFDDTTFIDTTNGLRLKRDHPMDMEADTSWTDEGSIRRVKIHRDDWIRIDGISVDVKS